MQKVRDGLVSVDCRMSWFCCKVNSENQDFSRGIYQDHLENIQFLGASNCKKQPESNETTDNDVIGSRWF